MIQEDDDFFELLSSRLLVEPVHSTKIRAAAVRLLLAIVSSWMVSNLSHEHYVKLNDTNFVKSYRISKYCIALIVSISWVRFASYQGNLEMT